MNLFFSSGSCPVGADLEEGLNPLPLVGEDGPKDMVPFVTNADLELKTLLSLHPCSQKQCMKRPTAHIPKLTFCGAAG